MSDSFIPLAEMKEQLGLTADQGDDDALIQRKIDAAENHIDRLLGYSMRTRWPSSADTTHSSGGENVPASLQQAVAQLAAWWFENREATTDMSRTLPFGVSEIVNEYRDWSF